MRVTVSSEVTIYDPHDERSQGRIFFEIVVGDSHVALVTDGLFEPEFAETSTFAIDADTEVSNLLWDEMQETVVSEKDEP